jgi:hypothetical protein
MYPSPNYPRGAYPAHLGGAFPAGAPHATAPGYGRKAPDTQATTHYPQDIRPLITRHRLRRQRRRKAATLLTGASIALGVAALRPPNAAAHSAAAPTSIAQTERQADSAAGILRQSP